MNFAKLIMHFVQCQCVKQHIKELTIQELMSNIVEYKCWSSAYLQQLWDSQLINNVTANSAYLVDYISAAQSIQLITTT
jgi:hypothetical protein